MDSEESAQYESRPSKKSNTLPIWGNERTMNMNNMVLTNIMQSPYFKNQLFQLKTYHEVVDEIFYKVDHLEPWEKGSRKTSGQVGMCGGVRGVGAGGIVSTAYCILYKLFTLRLTRKQLNGLISHVDSPYIRGLGFMYIRYCQPPADLWDWYEHYLEDEEEIDPKAGTGCPMTIGQLVRSFLLKLEWYGTLFPRIPVPIQKEIERKLQELNLCDDHKRTANEQWPNEDEKRGRESSSRDERPDRDSMDRGRDSRDRFRDRDSRSRRSRSRSRETSSRRDRDRDRRDYRDREKRRSHDRDRRRHSRSPERRRSRSRERKRDKYRDGEDKHKRRSREDSRERRGDSKSRPRSRSR